MLIVYIPHSGIKLTNSFIDFQACIRGSTTNGMKWMRGNLKPLYLIVLTSYQIECKLRIIKRPIKIIPHQKHLQFTFFSSWLASHDPFFSFIFITTVTIIVITLTLAIGQTGVEPWQNISMAFFISTLFKHCLTSIYGDSHSSRSWMHLFHPCCLFRTWIFQDFLGFALKTYRCSCFRSFLDEKRKISKDKKAQVPFECTL